MVAVGLGVPVGPLLVLRLDRVRDFGLASSLLTVGVLVAWGVVGAALAAGWWARPARRVERTDLPLARPGLAEPPRSRTLPTIWRPAATPGPGARPPERRRPCPGATRSCPGCSHEMSELLVLTGETGFRVRAYDRGARALSGYGADLSTLSERELAAIPGVGKAIAAKVREYLDTGRVAKLEELRAQVPPGLRALVRVPGLGPAKARLVHERLGAASPEELARGSRRRRVGRPAPG